MSNSATRGVYRANGVEIDCGTGLVRRNGAEIALRHKAHRVLLYLMERRSGPVSKEDLVGEVWGGAAITDDTLVNCVQEIRKALGDDARNPQFIRTLPKTGYWFVGPPETEPPPPNTASEPPPPPTRSRDAGLRAAAILALGLMGLAAWLILKRQPIDPVSTAPNPVWVEASWLRFDEGSGTSAADAARPGISIIRIPAGVEWIPGVSGAALRFRGVETAALSGSLPAVLASGTEDRTVVAWVRVQTNRADSTMIYSYGHPKDDASFHSFALGVHASGKAAAFSNRSVVVGQTVIDDGEWHQVAAVVSGGEKTRTVRIFVDGREDGGGTLNATAKTASPEPGFSVGRAMWGGTPLRGDVDDIRVYSRPLAPAELFGIHRCMTGAADLKDSPAIFFTPVMGMNAVLDSLPAGETSARFRNAANDYAGIAFARRVEGTGCPVRGAASIDMGQDLRLEADIKPSGNSSDQLTEAGPFFRSRRSAAGDGIVGGASAGFWVQLKSSGHVAVRRLNPSSTVAFTETVPAGFDPSKFHRMAVEVKGGSARVWLDGALLTFDQAGHKTSDVDLPPAWDNAKPKGRNGGAAGFAMGAEANRGRASGQEIRNILVRRL